MTSSIDHLLSIMTRLRDKEKGCPWDIEQDFASIAPHTIEEAYEVVDAISRNDLSHLKEELGDLLLQVIFHSQMASEINAFSFDDVVKAITDKLISRHPHIFGEAIVRTAEEQTAKWEEIKAKERQEKAAKSGKEPGILDDVPRNLPALMRASKLQKRAARVGFNWEHTGQILEKLHEEITELQAAIKAHASANNQAHITEEIGDILFVLCNLCNHLEVQPDMALQGACHKFERRFAYIEARLREKNRRPEESSLEEMDALWNEIRHKEKT